MINEKIYLGSIDTPILVLTNNEIEDIICNNDVDIIGDELSSDIFESNVFYEDSESVLKELPYATPLFYYSNDILVGKYYVNKIERKGVKRYLIRATSLIGLIENEDFYGGFYTGQSFDEVLYDVLFTNGIITDKYFIYYPMTQNNGSSAGLRMLTYGANVNQWKYRTHIEFTTVSINSTSQTVQKYSVIAGQDSSRYRVEAYANKRGQGVNTYWYFSVYYGGNAYSLGSNASPLIGDGSKITIDIDPVGQKILMKADYVQYDDPTISGQLVRDIDITTYTGTSGIYLGTVFGASNSSGSGVVTYNLQISWQAHKVYDENGDLIVDGVFVFNEDDNNYYVVNTVDSVKEQVLSTYYPLIPCGNNLGAVSDFSRLERSLELYHNIIYGEGITDITVRGLIKKVTKREALHQLLFAMNVCLLKTNDGQYLFTRITDYVSGSIDDDSLYDDSEEEYINPAKKIKIAEFSFESGSGESEKIFDNTSSIAIEGEYVAVFDKSPIYGTPVGNGITIIAYNCNAAIVTGRGTINGTVYNSSYNNIEYMNPNALDGRDRSVNGIGLITSVNSDSVMNKLKSYYSGNLVKISNSILFNGEKCGLKYDFNTLYGIKSAFLTSIKTRTSSNIKAQCKFIAGFVPETHGGYSFFKIATYNETWIVPETVRAREFPTIRLNLIGSGTDGTDGTDGENGKAIRNNQQGAMPAGEGGAGGNKGVGGDGGNIYSMSLNVANVKSISILSSEKETIVNTYNDSDEFIESFTTASGNKRENGITNVFTGLIYGRKGLDGFKGGKGGKGGWVTSQNTIIQPESGGDTEDYTGGVSFTGKLYMYILIGGMRYRYCSYCGGGGAAFGENGGNSESTGETENELFTKGGDGGNAIVNPYAYTEYGSGGFGGSGGGGGGGAGTITSYSLNAEQGADDFLTSSQYPPGYGGSGSKGTPGIDGCVIIYY